MIQRCIPFAYFSAFFDNRQHHKVPQITRYSMFNQSPGRKRADLPFGSGLAISKCSVSKKTVGKGSSTKYVQKGELSGQCGYGKLLRSVKIGTAIPCLLYTSFRTEISCQQVGRNLADLAPVRTILFHSHHTF